MSKFCGNCGASVEDNAVVCGNCGTPLEAEQDNSAAQSIPAISDIAAKAKEDPKALIKKFGPIAGAVVAVIVVLAIIISVAGGSGYKKTVENFGKAIDKEDAELLSKLISSYINDYSDEDEDEEELQEEKIEGCEEIIEEFRDYFDEELDGDYKVTCEIRKEKEISKKDMADFAEALSDRGIIDEDNEENIKKAVKLDLKVVAKEKKDTEDVKVDDVYLVKEKGGWKIISLYREIDY